MVTKTRWKAGKNNKKNKRNGNHASEWHEHQTSFFFSCFFSFFIPLLRVFPSLSRTVSFILALSLFRLSRGGSAESNCTSPSPSLSSSSSLKVDLIKEENHKREISAMKKRLVESENTIRKLKLESLNLQGKSAPCRLDGSTCAEVRRLQNEIHALRANNEKLEAKLRVSNYLILSIINE